MSEEDIVEFITNEKKIEHQYRTIKRLEKPSVSSVLKNDEINGFYECKDFMNKRLLNFREKSNPIAADGQIWSLECDFNGAVHGYVSLFIVNQSCNALKLDPPSLREIKVVLFNPKELHC